MKRVSVLLTLASFAFSGMAGDDVARRDVAAVTGQTVEVSIQDYRFSPQEIRIKVGDTVIWSNREKRTSHSILFPAENGLESDRIFPAEQWRRTFVQPGNYNYRCGPHEEMKGLVVVE